MKIISDKEFIDNEDKCFGLALNDEVIIQRGDDMFIVQSFVPNHEPDIIFEPNADFYRSITMEELRSSAHEHIRKLFE
jgi:hypothetical protein